MRIRTPNTQSLRVSCRTRIAHTNTHSREREKYKISFILSTVAGVVAVVVVVAAAADAAHVLARARRAAAVCCARSRVRAFVWVGHKRAAPRCGARA